MRHGRRTHRRPLTASALVETPAVGCWTLVPAARRQDAIRTLSALVERMTAARCPMSGEGGGEHDAVG